MLRYTLCTSKLVESRARKMAGSIEGNDGNNNSLTTPSKSPYHTSTSFVPPYSTPLKHDAKRDTIPQTFQSHEDFDDGTDLKVGEVQETLFRKGKNHGNHQIFADTLSPVSMRVTEDNSPRSQGSRTTRRQQMPLKDDTPRFDEVVNHRVTGASPLLSKGSSTPGQHFGMKRKQVKMPHKVPQFRVGKVPLKTHKNSWTHSREPCVRMV